MRLAMTRTTRSGSPKKGRRRKELSAARLDALIEEATVDANDESEQTTGFYTMLEEHLTMPFTTEVLGKKVTVERFDLTDDEEIVAVSARGKFHRRDGRFRASR